MQIDERLLQIKDGRDLMALRKSLGVTREYVAQKLNITFSTICRWEAYSPNLDRTLCLRHLLLLQEIIDEKSN